MKRHRPRVYNIHHGKAPPNAVNIMRPNRWGNPYRIDVDVGRKACIKKLRQLVGNNPGIRKMIKDELKGKDLVCCCKPKDCHGDVLLEIANDLPRSKSTINLPNHSKKGTLL